MILSLLGCVGLSPATGLAGFTTVTFVQDGVRLTAPQECPSLSGDVTGTLNGRPLTISDKGGFYLGSSQDGLTPARRCGDPLLVAGERPSGHVDIHLTDGVTTWDIGFDAVNSQKTLSVDGDLPRGGTVTLVTTPASATWAMPGYKHQSYTSISPVEHRDDESFYRACVVNIQGPDFGTQVGTDASGLQVAVARARPGAIELEVPAVNCPAEARLDFHGAVELAVTACPQGVVCSSWEEVEVRVPVRWAPR